MSSTPGQRIPYRLLDHVSTASSRSPLPESQEATDLSDEKPILPDRLLLESSLPDYDEEIGGPDG